MSWSASPARASPSSDETYDFIARLPFTYLHVFTFSARPGTPAAQLPDQVPVHVARERNRLLRELIAEKNAAFRARIHRNAHCPRSRSPAITRAASTDALTDNFLKLDLAGDHAPNRWVEVAITAANESGLAGALA